MLVEPRVGEVVANSDAMLRMTEQVNDDNLGVILDNFVPGNGTVDWEEVFRLLKLKSFDGYFSIDLEQLPDLKEKFLATKRFLEDCARRYGL